MPLSKCRWCGKKVPNPFRPYHEKVLCLVMRKATGRLLFDDLPKVKPPKEEPTEPGQTKLLSFGVER